MSRSVPVPLLLFAALAGLFARVGAAQTIGPELPPSPAGARVIELLRESREPGAPTGEDLHELLVVEIEDALPDVSTVLIRRQLPALEEGDELQTLSVPQRDHLRAALATLPRRQLRRAAEATEAQEAQESSDAAPAAALFLWSLCAEARDVTHLAELVLPAPLPTGDAAAPPAPDAACVQAFEEALVALLVREARTLDEIADLARACDPALRPALVRAVGGGGRSEGLRFLLDTARTDLELAPLAISQVRRLGAAEDVALNEAWGDYLLDRLDADEGSVCRLAVMATATVAEFDAVPQLLELAGQGGGLATDVFWALREMTGLRLPDDVSRWRRWFEDERAWYEDEFPGLAHDLRSPDPGRAVSALRGLAGHRYRRGEIVDELVVLLDDCPESLVPHVCGALGTLGSPRAARSLVELVEYGTSAAREAAQAALVLVTGRRDVAPDAGLWRAALGLRE